MPDLKEAKALLDALQASQAAPKRPARA
jgi:hypothetical protein